MDRKMLGRWGEEQAAAFLKKKKYKIVGINYTCRFGEIDVIAQTRDYIVFVEVKLRKNDDFAKAREFVTPAKQEKVKTAAQMWLSANETALQPRFDVIEIYAPEGEKTKTLKVNHIENAF
ncbi:MAG: YraN family protein [Oscillospiraceae bacterium]|nr:YraN family protein [Oscillospiraceae bacterium]MBR5260575.1 YraN family protein [Oscillospiraceae bacterium]